MGARAKSSTRLVPVDNYENNIYIEKVTIKKSEPALLLPMTKKATATYAAVIHEKKTIRLN